MKSLKKWLASLAAVVMMAGAVPLAGAESAGTAMRFTVQAAQAVQADEEEAARLEGVASPVTEEQLKAVNPAAELLEENGRIYMIRGAEGAGSVRSEADALRVAYSLLPLLGTETDVQLTLWTMLKPGEETIYVLQHMHEGLTVVGSTLKLAVGSDGVVHTVFSSLSAGNPESIGLSAITSEQAEQVVRERLVAEGQSDTVLPEHTDRVIIPAELDIDSDDTEPDRTVWVVYSRNPAIEAELNGQRDDLAFLAHYVDMEGNYLHCSAVSIPGDSSLRGGYAHEYMFAGMEKSTWSGTVTDALGRERELTVPVMRDPATGLYILGDADRLIAVADFAPFVYGVQGDDGEHVRSKEPVFVTTADNEGWDPEDLLTYNAMIQAYDFYDAMGWHGVDGAGTPVLLLNHMCYEDGTAIDNAAYVGLIDGWQCFSYGGDSHVGQAVDVMAHEFTHAVTTTTMITNLYEDDYGAINEAMSDIMGNICEMSVGATTDTRWNIGEQINMLLRSMADPHVGSQPEYIWDVYYTPHAYTPNDINDRGGVHSNSSVLNLVAAQLCLNHGMSLEEAARFWMTVACGMTAHTDYRQMPALLTWAAETAGLEAYLPAIRTLVAKSRMEEDGLPELLPEDQRLVILDLPDTETMKDPHWVMFAMQFNTERIGTIMGAMIEKALESLADRLFADVDEDDTADQAELWSATDTDLNLSEMLTEEQKAELVAIFNEAGLSELGELLVENMDTVEREYLLQKMKNELFSYTNSWVSDENNRIAAVTKRQPTVYVLLAMDDEAQSIIGAAMLVGDEWVDLIALRDAGLTDLLSFGFKVLINIPDWLAMNDTEASMELPSTGLETVRLWPKEAETEE